MPYALKTTPMGLARYENPYISLFLSGPVPRKWLGLA
jgi:hypothetical protein